MDPEYAFTEAAPESRSIRMKVVGVGGAGSNIVDRLMLSNMREVSLAVINTDQQALASSPVPDKVCIGMKVTGGLGTGGEADIGREAALADKARIEAMLKGVDLLFIAAGLGGGTGTGVSPVLAEMAVKRGILVIAFVTLPFTIERARKDAIARTGLESLRDACNAVIPLPNDLLLQEANAGDSVLDAFGKTDAWVKRAVKSIWAMIYQTGIINLDFSKLRGAFAHKAGKTLFGLGEGEGENAVAEAIADFRMCPLLHTPEFSKMADNLLVNILGGPKLGLNDVQYIMDSVVEEFGQDANLTFGAVVDEHMSDRVEICVIGTSDLSDVPAFKKYAQPDRKVVATTIEETKVEIQKKPESKQSKIEAVFASTHSEKAQKSTHSSRIGKIRGEQDEFAFNKEEPKGKFENAGTNVFEGQDLDTPTYWRKGIKIPI